MTNVTQRYCVFNLTRESFLSLGVAKADTSWSRLRGLLGRRRLRPNDGLWVVPSQGIHTIGMAFAIDVIFLDKHHHVVQVIEHLGPFRIGPIYTSAASVIELPLRSVGSSQTQPGDRFLICSPDEMVQYLKHGEHRPELGRAVGQG